MKEVLNRAEEGQSEIVVAEEDAYECSPNGMATDNAQEKIEMKIDKIFLRLDEVEDNLSTRLNNLTDRMAQASGKQSGECRGSFSEY